MPAIGFPRLCGRPLSLNAPLSGNWGGGGGVADGFLLSKAHNDSSHFSTISWEVSSRKLRLDRGQHDS